MSIKELMYLIEEVRFRKQLKVQELAAEIGISYHTYLGVKKETKAPQNGTLFMIVRYLQSEGYEIKEIDLGSFKINV